MNRTVSKELKKIAQGLPVVYIKKRVNVRRRVDGMPSIVHTETTATANHEEQLKKVYRLQGEAGVLQYIQSTHRVHRGQRKYVPGWLEQMEAQKRAEAAAANPSWYQRAWQWVKTKFEKWSTAA